MSTKRLWAIAGGAAVLVAIIVLVLMLTHTSPEPEPTPTASPTAEQTPTSSPTPSAAPTPTSAPPAAVAATCDNTATDLFRSMMATNAWVSWQTQDQQIGARPFDILPNGSPDGAIVCRWGADPNVATDNVIDLAWAPIDPENAVAAMQKLEDQGFTRIEETDGVYLAKPGTPGYADADGWGETYYFGFADVRWAATKADVTNYVKAPDEAR